MVKKGSKSYSILYNKCPKCHRGKFWHKNNPYLNILKDNKLTNDHCNRCKFKYEIEPGFWLGALWTSYPLVVLIEIPFLFTAILAYDVNPFIAIGLMAFLFLIMWSTILRLGRSIWINLSVHFDEAWKEEN